MFLDILIGFLLVIHILVSLFMVLIVLMQRPKNEGLGAAFGGGMTDNLFGAQTTNVLQKFTVYLGATFFALTLILAVLYARRAGLVDKNLIKELTTPVEANAPATPGASPVAIPAADAVPAPADAAATPVADTTAPAAAVEVTPAAEAPAAPVDAPAAPVDAPATPADASTTPTAVTDTPPAVEATTAPVAEPSSTPQ